MTPTASKRKTCSLEEVIAAVAKARGERWEEFRDRHGDRGRDLALFLARRATGLTTSQLAEAMGLKQHANVSMAVRRYAVALAVDKEERASAERAADLLHVTL
jgi:chromosomal replication initiation ATPase DnaA